MALHRRCIDIVEGKVSTNYTAQPSDPPYLYQRVVAELMSTQPDWLTMEQHRLKHLYQKYHKSMSGDVAWEVAVKEVERIRKRSKYIFPRFSKQEMQNIARWRRKGPKWMFGHINEVRPSIR